VTGNALSLLTMERLPRPVFVRQQEMPARHYFPAHTHNWHQLLYAVSGVLVVSVVGERFFIPPEKAIWLPEGCEHSVYSEFGADLKSLYIASEYDGLPSDKTVVLRISPLIKALILEAAGFEVAYPLQGYEQSLISLMLQTLSRLPQDEEHLPWPVDRELFALCNRLYEHPGDRTMISELVHGLSMSGRTLDRKFRKETGMSLQAWRGRLRLMKAIELLNTGQSITQIALELGYSSPSPFIYMFREHTGISPAQYRKQQESGQG